MKKQTGVTLIEIMISLLIGLIVISATIGIYVTAIRGSTDTLRSARLNYDLDSAMQLMMNDIRRAGYWGGAVAGANSQINPFTAATTNAQILTVNTTNDCILYTYDANGSGVLTPAVFTDDVDANEYYGFRRSTIAGNRGIIEMRLTGTTTANCADGVWQALSINDNSGEQLDITRLEFSFNAIAAAGTVPALPATSKCLNTASLAAPSNTLCANATVGYLVTGQRALETRQVNIVITGVVANDAAVTKTITNSVKIRNDRVFTQP
ncbi:MAG: prepilin-type N-terminal cleavage/methylation domain-containing protein [Methylobacter sp.]|nr:prepilin-type N-terminal cleavage/methylation domain-containing protein [Methylobacter sp.]